MKHQIHKTTIIKQIINTINENKIRKISENKIK